MVGRVSRSSLDEPLLRCAGWEQALTFPLGLEVGCSRETLQNQARRALRRPPDQQLR